MTEGRFFRALFVMAAIAGFLFGLSACAPATPHRNIWREMIDNGDL